MDVLHDRVAGLDVHKKTVVACVRTPSDGRARRSGTREFETFIGDLERLRDWLAGEGVTHVAMEATGVFWKPVVRHEALFDRAEMKGLRLRAVAAVR